MLNENADLCFFLFSRLQIKIYTVNLMVQTLYFTEIYSVYILISSGLSICASGVCFLVYRTYARLPLDKRTCGSATWQLIIAGQKSFHLPEKKKLWQQNKDFSRHLQPSSSFKIQRGSGGRVHSMATVDSTRAHIRTPWCGLIILDYLLAHSLALSWETQWFLNKGDLFILAPFFSKKVKDLLCTTTCSPSLIIWL